MPGPRVTAADLLPAEPTPFRWSMGVKPLEMDHWLLQDDDYDSDVAEVQQLLETRHSDIVHSLPGSHDAASEVYKAMASHLVERDPRRFGTISAGPPPIDDMTPRLRFAVVATKTTLPEGSIAITAPYPSTGSMVSTTNASAAFSSDSPANSTRAQMSLATVQRMKYSPCPVPETAQDSFAA